jgi:hypothetical protein
VSFDLKATENTGAKNNMATNDSAIICHVLMLRKIETMMKKNNFP